MKWFWFSFFAFLTVLILALGVWRPDLLTQATVFIGWYLAVLLGIALVALAVGAGLAGWLVWRKGRLASLRQRDGAFPIQRVKLRDGAVLYYDPNQSVGPATIVHPQYGLIEVAPQAGWDVQLAVRLAVERTRQLQAMYPGDDARMNRHGARSAVPRASAAQFRDQKPARLPAPPEPVTIDVDPEPKPAPVRLWAAADGLNMGTRTKLPMGQTAGADLVHWNLVESPHIRVHGKSQGAGKTNLIRTVAAGALRVGHHVIVCDRRRFKDWSEFDGKAELIDVRDPRRFAEVAEQLAVIYRERDGELGRHGAPNISRLPAPPQRIVVVVAEFGALCAQADADGVLDDVLHPLTMVLREAGAAGVHVVIEDQVVDRRWPRGISTNAEPVTGYLPQNYGAAGGYYDAHKLPAYTFHFGGAVFTSWDMRPVVGGVLANVPAARSIVPGVGGGVSSSVSGAVFPEVFPAVSPEVDPPPPGVGNSANKWDEFILAYMEKHPELWQQPPRGVRDLARAMSRHEQGDESAEDSFVGIASKTVKRFRDEAYLPGGERLGTDVSWEE